MADHTKIEWSEATLNVVTGCTRVSEGCDHCYIERTPPFRMAGRRFDGPGVGGHIPVQLHRERLTQALRWRRPRRIFVPSLGDLFHAAVPDELLEAAFAVMAVTPRHTYQITTKRPARMRSVLSNHGFWSRVAQEIVGMAVADQVPDARTWMHRTDQDEWYPLPNTWLGVSVEDQHWADIRVPILLDTPAAVRWISAEPLLGPVDLGIDRRERGGSGINWIVVGGESGPGARRMDLEWARSLVAQSQQAGVAVFVKQLGERWARHATWGGRPVSAVDRHGGNPDYWPADLHVREYPEAAHD